MKRFKDFVLEGDVVQFPSKSPPPSEAKSYIAKKREEINNLKPHIESIYNEPLHKNIVKDMTPTITNQYKGVDVHPVEQLHQHITYANEDLHYDPKVAQERKSFAKNIASTHKQAILDDLDDKIDRATALLDKHEDPVRKHFESAGGIIGHLKRMRDDFSKV